MKAYYIVVNENTLCYIGTESSQKWAQILAGSPLRGATHNWQDGIISLYGCRVRPATKEDFDTFRVQLPPDFE